MHKIIAEFFTHRKEVHRTQITKTTLYHMLINILTEQLERNERQRLSSIPKWLQKVIQKDYERILNQVLDILKFSKYFSMTTPVIDKQNSNILILELFFNTAYSFTRLILSFGIERGQLQECTLIRYVVTDISIDVVFKEQSPISEPKNWNIPYPSEIPEICRKE